MDKICEVKSLGTYIGEGLKVQDYIRGLQGG